MELRETVIVGGGIAGLACGRRLRDAGREFALVTEEIGGRIRRSQDGAVNLGAYYVMADYRHVLQFVTRGRALSNLRTRVHVGDRSYTARNWRSLAYLPQGLRLRRLLREFRSHYEAFKKRCETTSQAQAIRDDPYLWELYRHRASDLVEEHRVGEFVEAFTAPGLHGSTFLPVSRLSAFVFLQFTLPMIVPIYEFAFRLEEMIRGFEDAIRIGSATAVTREGDTYRIETARGEVFRASNLVLAAPIEVSRKLLALGEVKKPVRAHMFAIAGTLRRPFASGEIHLFAEGDPTFAISRHDDGAILFCSSQEQPDFDRFFEGYRLLEHHCWNPAFNLEGSMLLECEQRENLYLIGDHNVCGLEDSFITGLYAANRILGEPRGDLGGSRVGHVRGGSPGREAAA